MKFGVTVFPGSNCDQDALYAASLAARTDAVGLWHKDSFIPPEIECVIVPGGFSYGDYLRCGAIARFSPIMREVAAFADRGGLVMGICNGFQILTEAGLLPGALLKNDSLTFVCRDVYLAVENLETPFTRSLAKRTVRFPIAHGEGNYFADEQTIQKLEADKRVVLRYADAEGNAVQEANPNGSRNNIAGIINERGNVFGLMPHPERAAEDLLGCSDGMAIFDSIVRFCSQREAS